MIQKNYFSPANLKYKPHVLIAANNIYIYIYIYIYITYIYIYTIYIYTMYIYRTIRKKIFAVLNVKSKVRWYKCRRVVLSH